MSNPEVSIIEPEAGLEDAGYLAGHVPEEADEEPSQAQALGIIAVALLVLMIIALLTILAAAFGFGGR